MSRHHSNGLAGVSPRPSHHPSHHKSIFTTSYQYQRPAPAEEESWSEGFLSWVMVQASDLSYPGESSTGVAVKSVNSSPTQHRYLTANENNFKNTNGITANSSGGATNSITEKVNGAGPSTARSGVVVESCRQQRLTSTTGQVMLVIRPLLARTATSRQGREHQRFDGDCRLVAGCIPVIDGKVVLVSSSRKQSWILPKGGWEDDETAEQSAVREAYEEAGVVGVVGSGLRDVAFSNKHGGPCRLTTYVLYVTEVLETWPESDRSRILVSVDEALRLCSRPEMREAMIEMRDKGLHLLNPTPRPVKGVHALSSSPGANSSE